ncbi:MAG: protein kinase [Myxococcota bacterium]
MSDPAAEQDETGPGSRTRTVASPHVDSGARAVRPEPRRRRPRPAREETGARPQPGDVLHADFRYQIVRRLGRGGFGSVYMARCLDAGEPGAPPAHVAIKVLGSSRDPRAASALKRELAALLAIEDDRIPKVYDWSLDGENAFVAMQYFAAGSLADAWPFLDHRDEQQVWRLITDLLQALSAAHRAGILHLDLKPSNVLLDGDGGFVLTDFGVSQAARMSKGLLHQGKVAVGLGTHGYRAPEQDKLSLKDFDLRTDLWGVGATAWALYTGIDLNKRQEVLRRAEDGYVYGLPLLSDVAISCPPPLEEVVMSLLFIDPDRRPGGASQVLAQVRAIASGFGLDSQTVASARRSATDPTQVQAVIDAIVDPLWSSISKAPGFDRYFAKYEDGEVLASHVDGGFHTFLLLSGTVEVVRNDAVVDIEDREGAMLCAISTLTGAPRELTLRARGTVWTCVFNEAELEQLITCNSSVAVRMLRQLAKRVASGPPRHGSAAD